MSVTQRTTSQDASQEMRCTRCNSVLPPHAIFCGTCGERVNKESLNVSATQPDTTDLSERYRITSLIRRSGYAQTLLAMDTRHQRPVLIRDIDISSLDPNAKNQALEAAQREYDLLRRLRIPDVTPLIDLRYSHDHLYVVGGWPFPLLDDTKEGSSKAHTPTLRDLLQSGIGLPSEYIALSWLHRLSVVVGRLHTIYIFLGDLDPSTIIVSDTNYDALPALAVAWLPTSIRSLLKPLPTPLNEGLFMAPEALTGEVQQRSDIYSLGALLYLLLTGSSPDEQRAKAQRPGSRSGDMNLRVSGAIENILARTLAPDANDRYKRVEELEEALLLAIESLPKGRKERSSVLKKGKRGSEGSEQGSNDEPKSEAEEVTISIVSLQSELARWQLEQLQSGAEDGHAIVREAIANTPTISTAHIRDALLNTPPETPPSLADEAASTDDQPGDADRLRPEPMPRTTPAPKGSDTGEMPLMQRFKERVSGLLPALPRSPKAPATDTAKPVEPQKETNASFLKRLQHFLLGEQLNTTTAAALIETPLRVQPNQSYAIRVHLMGRDSAKLAPRAKKGSQPVGLSALVRNEIVHIEVRSSVFQSYAYAVQRADVHLPGEGFAAEVTMPMQPLSNSQNGRREHLQIFFMDEVRRPLYEKPFTIEVLVSHLVQAGREGHTVLTIPI